MRRTHLLATALLLSLCIVSTVFVLLTTTSPNWARQSYYFAQDGISDGTGLGSPVCAAARSPFYRCGIPEVYANETCSIPFCQFYKPYGTDATSCRSPNELGIPADDAVGSMGLFGSASECQQVHYAGNLQIAAAVFVTLGLLVSLPVAALALTRRGASHEEHFENDHHRPHDHGKVSRRSRTGPFLVLSLLVLLSIGALLQFIAQFFAILALTINATPRGADVPSDQPLRDLKNFVADDWVVDTALGAYATVAWTTAVAAVVVAALSFRMPSFSKLL